MRKFPDQTNHKTMPRVKQNKRVIIVCENCQGNRFITSNGTRRCAKCGQVYYDRK